MIIEITDISVPELDPYARLTERQLLRFGGGAGEGLFIAESRTVVSLALDAGYEPVSMLMEKGQLYGASADLAQRCSGVPIYTADKPVLERLTGFSLSRGVLSAMKRKKPPTVGQACSGARRIAVLDRIMDSTNVGAIMRGAAALGIDAALVTENCSDPLLRRSARVSMGTVFQIPWTYIPDDYIGILKDMGFLTAAAALSGDSVSVADPRLKKADRLALILGNEGEGLSENIISSADYIVKIPMRRGVDSLNVAAAAAVLFWEISEK